VTEALASSLSVSAIREPVQLGDGRQIRTDPAPVSRSTDQEQAASIEPQLSIKG